MSLGGTAVDFSAAASFRLKRAIGKPSPLDIDVLPWNSISGKYYQKQEGKHTTFIERSTYRIDSPGEIEGISALGWVAHQPKIKKRIQPNMITKKVKTPIEKTEVQAVSK